MKKLPKNIELGLIDDCIITINLDGNTTHNIHLANGFEKSFDRLVEIFSECFHISVNKERTGLSSMYSIERKK